MISILAIETSTDACSVALHSASGDVFRYAQEPRSHTQLVMKMINEVLIESSIKVSEIDALSVSVGPGSFTGLRIGFAAAQGLAFGLDIPVVPVSSLEVMVATYIRKMRDNSLPDKSDGDQTVMVVLDARMGEFNCGCYNVNCDGQISTYHHDRLLKAEDAIKWMQELSPSAIIGDGDKLVSSGGDWSELLTHVYPNAVDLLGIALPRYRKGEGKAISSIDLVYLRGTEAWQRRKRIREA
ncbi:MAG: tRNA (adenosine(37)-N6)-threonylcarbamoyltransferase complex dimerization subunit type 1 TsaB [SAR92 clade bacterium]|uniref:tRNA threonylcarbamoyladenosine biosynthesis protein TsaB n=1 Tax=SAR92 clade bacterium TaxID=2315479 RepID=A0A520MP04_9GAMM|nr:MAG: tRNA (adenosine(37)-N6)-threonylcarbamoyltransferase complex dimerization subunit type 1 TsaB [SAR92 clade bacterium]